MLPKFPFRKVNLGLLISTAIMLIILITCFCTFGWVVDYKPYSTECGNCFGSSSGPCKAADYVCSALVGGACSPGTTLCGVQTDTSGSCDFSLEEAKCDGGTSDLDGDFKKAADVMIGLGAMCWIFLFINLLINIVIQIEKFTSFYRYMTIAGMVLCAVTWLFLTCGWGHYADKKGGVPSGDVDYGASFVFVIFIWLALFPYTFFWVILWNSLAEPDDNAPVPDEKVSEPNSAEYPSAAPAEQKEQNGVVSTPAGGGASKADDASQADDASYADDASPADEAQVAV